MPDQDHPDHENTTWKQTSDEAMRARERSGEYMGKGLLEITEVSLAAFACSLPISLSPAVGDSSTTSPWSSSENATAATPSQRTQACAGSSSGFSVLPRRAGCDTGTRVAGRAASAYARATGAKERKYAEIGWKVTGIVDGEDVQMIGIAFNLILIRVHHNRAAELKLSTVAPDRLPASTLRFDMTPEMSQPTDTVLGTWNRIITSKGWREGNKIRTGLRP
ncbi:hypothetical protein B0H13DRAFT_2272367 [Mycena leptocephala]|nr:hypothetical protein B0H13DRAFT_2272367 [Mycena leptocephala]